MDWDRVLDVFFDMVQDIVESITLPTGNSVCHCRCSVGVRYSGKKHHVGNG